MGKNIITSLSNLIYPDFHAWRKIRVIGDVYMPANGPVKGLFLSGLREGRIFRDSLVFQFGTQAGH